MRTIWVIVLLFAFMAVSGNTVFAQNTQVNIGWNANAEQDLAGYKLYKGASSGVYDGVVDVGSVVAYPVILADGTHYIAVTAYDTSGNESGYSEELVLSTDATSPVPATGLREISRIVTTTTTTTTIFLPISP